MIDEQDLEMWEHLPMVENVLTSAQMGAWLYYRDKRRDARNQQEHNYDNCHNLTCRKKEREKGFQQGRTDERVKVNDSVNAIIQYVKENSILCDIEGHSFKMVGSNLVISLLEQIKEQSE